MDDMMLNSINYISITNSKSGKPSLKVTCENNALKTLHSIYDPEAEARSIVNSFQFNGEGIIVVLGLGLGYHVAELSRCYPETKIIVIETSSEIYELARGNGPWLNDNITLIVGSSPEESLRQISNHQMKNGVTPVKVFPLSSEVSAFPSFYDPILSSLKNTESVKLWDKLRYPKFQTESLTVLMIDSGYFLLTETEKALRSNGHKVVRVQVNKSDNGDKVISGIMEAIVNFKPDFLLTVNHLGLDEEGKISDFLKSIEMPVASWYVDSPNLIVKAFNKNVSPYMALFIWDRSYINDMKSMGFEFVEYMPLGTDEKIFRTLLTKKHRRKLSPYLCDVSFVGNSMIGPVNEWMAKIRDDIKPVAERLSEMYGRSATMDEMMTDSEKEITERLTKKEKMDLEAAVIWKSTLNYRLGCIKKLLEYGTRIYGDNHWKKLLNNTVDICKPLNYYKELPYLYNGCKINFNATSLQMKEAVNQRVFDVPACGAFILTDDQESLHDLFDVGDEIITFKDKEEIPEIVKFYLNNPEKRQCIALKGRERVMNNHTYKHRLASMIEFMIKRYKMSLR